ncbi:MAG: SpoIIIAH-like family protein [Firmicutes bacterium]|nr:SpoIIIAH-like family protein [Bacillota bacterium]
MINKKNLWFLTLFSLILVLSVYYITMPTELLMTNNSENIDSSTENVIKTNIDELSVIEALKIEDNTNTLESINKLKETIANNESTTEDKNQAFDALKTLNQVSSKEELLEEKIKTIHDLDSFVKIDGDQIRVVINSEEHSNTIANNIMRTVQNNFDTKQYISIQFK